MSNILLVEPDYRSKFPPLGLMRLSTYHKSIGDQVTFVRGLNEVAKSVQWHRIYVSSLFTWELPRTVKTVKYYRESVTSANHVFVGGVGATLLPQYMSQHTDCNVITGQLDKPGTLGKDAPAIAELVPDYGILDSVDYDYYPRDAYFARITQGCIRNCKFCAVPILETRFGFLSGLNEQIREVDERHGKKQHLVVLDNNILGIETIYDVIGGIAELGFECGAKRNGKLRTVDFNQGLDARLISDEPQLARALRTICLSPVRLAFDFVGMKNPYQHAIRVLHDEGFSEFTNYMLFNFEDSPRDLFERFWINAKLNQELGIRITGFPMRFIPMDDVRRDHVSRKWKWRFLRGIQCVLLATHGLVSPNPEFVQAAFGDTYEEFIEILSMPDRYIIYRNEFARDGADRWRRKFRRLDETQKDELLDILQDLNKNFRDRKERIARLKRPYKAIVEHYYPNGGLPARTPKEELLAQQGVSVGYDTGPG